MDFHDDVTSYLARLKAALDLLDTGAIARLAALLADALDTGRDVFIFGNGGSAANASHITVDLAKGASYGGARRLRWHCLCDNVPVLTAYANDVGYDAVFVEPLRNLLRPGDLVIAMSGSGNSRNVIRAVEYAREVGATVVGITGYSGGALRGLSDLSLHLPVDDMQLAEDVQLVIGHIAMRALARHQGIAGCG
jgi:D-sedoheptulose 7-phosphate isomerase